MENLREEMLTVRVDITAIDYLRRTAALANRTFIVSIVFSCIFVASSLLYTLAIDPEKFVSNLALYLQVRCNLWVSIGVCIMMLVQLYQYRRFTRQAYKATHFTDSEKFNDAFRILYKSSVLAFVQLAANATYGLLVFWVNLSFFAAVRAKGL
jgi:hypothetical protein